MEVIWDVARSSYVFSVFFSALEMKAFPVSFELKEPVCLQKMKAISGNANGACLPTGQITFMQMSNAWFGVHQDVTHTTCKNHQSNYSGICSPAR